MELQSLITNPNAEEKGVWIEFGDAKLLIAGENSPKYKAAVRKHTQKQPRHALRDNPDTAEKVATEAIADAIFLDFQGITEKGKPIENNRENRLRLLKVPAIINFIADQMTRLSNFQADRNEEEAAALK